MVPANELSLNEDLWHRGPSRGLGQFCHHLRIVSDVDRFERQIILLQKADRILTIRATVDGEQNDRRIAVLHRV